ncbi:MAG: glycolate oxidase subunit GlcF [Gammaproteobacteria bacterium]|nr:glycolate oxidase subunit GlcF [Gammaproteobacteria bacterium]
METHISRQFENNPYVQEAESILRACVHCGFCTATCPTYQILGNELDSPRGRIYLIKQVLEGNEVSRQTQQHLDRCLTCRSCESTCPSGVRYARLLDIGREIVDQKVARTLSEKIPRWLLKNIVPYPKRMRRLLKIGHVFKPLLPNQLKQKLPLLAKTFPEQKQSFARKMVVLHGCAQSVVTPQTNQAMSRVLAKLGIELIHAQQVSCCGAVNYHLADHDTGLDFMRRNIDAWWPLLEQGAEAIVISASGCGAMVKDYVQALQHDVQYAQKAKRISEMTSDICEVIRKENLQSLEKPKSKISVTFHSPCTLQHGQQLDGVVESILIDFGFELNVVDDAHICCGSAGTYSVLQPELSQQLLDNKLLNLKADKPDVIVTANVGCQMHLNTKTDKPVRHWIELLDEPDLS